jgi:CelD/BcsL family acetyltransferase involved in cellulose biosynthesis
VIEEVATLGALEALAPEWDALCDRDVSSTPFQRPAWLLPWTRHLGPQDLVVLASRRAGRLVGLLPGFVWKDGDELAFALLGAGLTDYLDAVADPEAGEDVVAELVSALFARGGFDRVDFDELRPGSPLLSARADDHVSDTTEPASTCPILELSRGLEVSVPAPTRRNYRNAKHRAARRGDVRAELARGDGLVEALEALVALHSARWRDKGEAGVLSDPRVVAFHRDAMTSLDARGLVRMHVLRAGERVAAVIHALAEKKEAYYYLQGIDPELAQLSPGTLLLGHALEHAIAEGIERADFLRGRESYKYAWGAVDRPSYRRRWRVAR